MSQSESLQQVGVGTHVTIELIDQEGNREPLAFVIVREAAADLDQGWLSVNTPLAKALLGKFVGRTVAYKMGDVQSVYIVGVQPGQAAASTDVAQHQEAVLKKALDAAARTNAEIFAASFNGKWGDYNLPDA